MKYANQVSEIINAFSPEPLKGAQMEEFYCSDTMECRMGDPVDSPIRNIIDEIYRKEESRRAFLLLGHRGCGKSTELNRLSAELSAKGYRVRTIFCNSDLDMVNIVYSDLFILMGEALLGIAGDCGCAISKDILDNIMHFWDEGTETSVSMKEETMDTEVGMSAETPGLFNALKIFAKIKADLKVNQEVRKEYQRKISIRSSDWMELLRKVAKEIADKTEGKQPIIIFEDLDKLNPENAWNLFYSYAAVLSGMPFPVIYTFPIALSYDTRYAAMEGYFNTETLPMIKIETIQGDPYNDGINILREIIKKRADLNLFEDGVLDSLIKYSGGSLRDLFYTINSAAKRAKRRDSESVSMEDAERALQEVETALTRRIEKKDYEFLINIHTGNKQIIEDKQMLLRMLQAMVVLEYNGKRWHNLHPLVTRFFTEQGLI